MSRKDYEAIAAAIREVVDSHDANDPANVETFEALYAVVRNVSDALAADNPNFNRDRFTDEAYGVLE